MANENENNQTNETAQTSLEIPATAQIGAVNNSASEAINPETLSDDELDRIIAGESIGDRTADGDGDGADGADGADENDDEPNADNNDDAPNGADAESAAFTADADDETFFTEADAFLESFEDSPETAQMRQIVDRYKAALGAQSERVQEIESLGDISRVRNFSTALDDLVSKARQAENGVFVADTKSFRELMKKEYAGEYVQILEDELTQPSEKYHGYSLMQELIADHFGFTDEKSRAKLEQFMTTRGETGIPDYLPTGIENAVAEAFWKSPERAAIEDRLSVLRDILDDENMMDYEKNAARQELAGLNRNLALIQQGLNADRRDRTEQDARLKSEVQAVETRAVRAYEEDAIAVERNFAAKIAAKLSVLGGADAPAAKITARSIATLTRDALSENESFAAAARNDLKELGINFDFQKGYQTLDRLYQKNREIVFKEAQISEAQKTGRASRVNPRSVEISRQDKAGILRELNALETELLGKIMTVIGGGANSVLQKKAKAAAAPKPRFVPKSKSTEAAAGGGDRFAHLTDEELAKFAAAEQRMKRGLS